MEVWWPPLRGPWARRFSALEKLFLISPALLWQVNIMQKHSLLKFSSGPLICLTIDPGLFVLLNNVGKTRRSKYDNDWDKTIIFLHFSFFFEYYNLYNSWKTRPLLNEAKKMGNGCHNPKKEGRDGKIKDNLRLVKRRKYLIFLSKFVNIEKTIARC